MQFEQLAEQYTPMIHRIMMKLHIYQNKEDFFQVGMIALWEAQENYDAAKGPFPPYAYSYIQGRIMNALTKENRFSNQTVLSEEPLLMEGVDTEPTPESKVLLKAYGDCLTGRPKTWFELAIIKGLSNPDIARKFDITPAAVRKWQLSAQRTLQEEFGKNN